MKITVIFPSSLSSICEAKGIYFLETDNTVTQKIVKIK